MSSEQQEREAPYNPWRDSLVNCVEGSNYLRSGEYLRLADDIDAYLAEIERLKDELARATHPAPVVSTPARTPAQSRRAEMPDAMAQEIAALMGPEQHELRERFMRWATTLAPVAEPVRQAAEGIEAGWKIESHPPVSFLTEEANRASAWSCQRTEPPFCDETGNRMWNGPTISTALQKARQALNLSAPQQAQGSESGEAVAFAAGLDPNMRGFLDVMAWSEGEFTIPLYTHPAPVVSTPAQGVAGETTREAVANAIWLIRREDEDRCDIELTDLKESHPVWAEADAAIAVLAAIPQPSQPATPAPGEASQAAEAVGVVPTIPPGSEDLGDPRRAMTADELQEFCIALDFEEDDYTVSVIRAVEDRMLAKQLFFPVAAQGSESGEVADKGPWTAFEWKDGRVGVESDDFAHDAALTLTGDFKDQQERRDYCLRIAEKLNAAAANDQRDAALRELELARKLHWLAAREYIFFASYNEEIKDWDDGAHPAINCSDVLVMGADAEALKPEHVDAYIQLCREFPKGGADAAWCAVKRAVKPWRDRVDIQIAKRAAELLGVPLPEVLAAPPASDDAAIASDRASTAQAKAGEV